MEKLKLKDLLPQNPYWGRGIILGLSEDRAYAVCAYFIMGRIENSRNRIFVAEGDNINIKAFDESKIQDTSLTHYYPLKVLGNTIIVTNGDQTDTIYDYLSNGRTFEEALNIRCFEPDTPNYTPRISGIMHINEGAEFKLSILKSADGNAASCNRFVYSYDGGLVGGRFIHTYMGDSTPLRSFEGEPWFVELSNDIDETTKDIWSSLNEENKISLFVRYIGIYTGFSETRIVNKHLK